MDADRLSEFNQLSLLVLILTLIRAHQRVSAANPLKAIPALLPANISPATPEPALQQ
jgi:hypothetical protein